MDNKSYLLTVSNSNIFKEIILSEKQPVLKIGTLQDCDIRLKKEIFEIPISILISLESEHWHISCSDELYISSKNVKYCKDTAVYSGDIFMISNAISKEQLLTLTFSYDFISKSSNFDTILDIRNVSPIIIGNTENSNIILENSYINSEYVIMARDRNGAISVNAQYAPNCAALNGIRIFEKEELKEYDFISVADYIFYYKNNVLYTVMRPDLATKNIPMQPLRNETPAFNYPKLNRSPRMLYSFNADDIEVLLPPSKPEKPRENLVLQLSPALLMLGVTVLTRSGLIGGLNTGGPSFLIFSLATMTVGIVTTIMSFVYNKKNYKKKVEEWNSDYNNYIKEKLLEIQNARSKELAALNDTYPSVEQLRDFVKMFSGRIFERFPENDDFLNIRVGSGEVEAKRKVVCHQEEHIKNDNEFFPIPKQICEDNRFIENAPVRIHLKENGSVGVLCPTDEQYEFFKTLILDLCVTHSYEDVQIIVLVPKGQEKTYEWIKWLPHIKNSAGDFRGIVCDDESRDNVFEYIYALMSKRAAEVSEDSNVPVRPYYAVFVLEEYGIKTHPLYKFAENSSQIGFCFLYFKKYKESLPKECKEIVEISESKDTSGVLRYAADKESETRFVYDRVKDESIKFVAERLAPVYCEKITLSSRLTSNITLFELLNIISPENIDLMDVWKHSNVLKSMAVPLGVDSKGNKICLDLHEKAHGPHGLVAGTTGSGKSEIMQSYILSAAVKFHPYDVSFVIIDFKGGGMANQFEMLPHLIGKITDIDSYEINRSLLSIRAELEKRKRLFAKFGVNHIDKYIEKFHKGEADIALPHIVLIVDEFAELKAEQPEFMKELISTARIGRSLGIHLILATQKPDGQVNEQIWSNSRFKLCLKVATKADSEAVLKSPLASEIREPGRAYLQVGNNEIFTLFQSAYSGASAFSDKNGNIREFSISEVSFTGKKKSVYNRKSEKTDDGNKITQLFAMVDYINKYCNENNIKKLPSICPPPLPEIIDYKSSDNKKYLTLKIGEYDDPANQMQPPVNISLSDGNIFIIGAAQTGKTTLLHNFIRGLAENYSPKYVSIYILDFASKALKIYESLNHVGGVLTDSDDEKLKNFFKMMGEIITDRKEKFSSMGFASYSTYLESVSEPDIPQIVIIIDNLLVFRETYQNYEEEMLNICRESSALGITVIATAKQTSGISYKFISNFPTRLAFNCTEGSEYSNIFDRCRIKPKNVQGRGLVSIDKEIYEYQAYMPFDGIYEENSTEILRSESKRVEQIKQFIADCRKKYGDAKAYPVPSIPASLTGSYWAENGFAFDNNVIPVALTYSEIEPVALNIYQIGTLAILGREQFGKSNFVRIIMKHLQRHVFDLPCEAYLIDDYDRQLSEYDSYGFVQQITIDCSDFADIIQSFSDAAQRRQDLLRLNGSLENEPLMLCLVQNTQIYNLSVVDKKTVDEFKRLISLAKQLKMCFIFSNVENNGEYSPSDIIKTIRDFNRFVFLEDISNIKLLQNKFSVGDQKMYKKPIAVGEGYYYESSGNLEKIKIVKCERND